MLNSVSHWFSRHPYGITSIVFIIIVFLGWRMLGWGERQLGFLLLLYFIVTLGIRLDDISRAIGGPGGNPRIVRGEPESLAAQLRNPSTIASNPDLSRQASPQRRAAERRRAHLLAG